MLNVLSCTIGQYTVAAGDVLPAIISFVVTALKIIVPIILIIFGMIDLMKAVMSNDEKEMKGAQTKLLKRVIYAVAVFLVVSIVQIVFGALGSNTNEQVGGTSVSGCIDCFINNKC